MTMWWLWTSVSVVVMGGLWRWYRFNRLLDQADQPTARRGRAARTACCVDQPMRSCQLAGGAPTTHAQETHFDIPTLLGDVSEQQLVLLETMITYVEAVQQPDAPDTSTYLARPRLSSDALPVVAPLHDIVDEALAIDAHLVDDEIPHEIDITHWTHDDMTATAPWRALVL